MSLAFPKQSGIIKQNFADNRALNKVLRAIEMENPVGEEKNLKRNNHESVSHFQLNQNVLADTLSSAFY